MDEHLPAMRLHVDAAGILAYAALTEDFNPIHTDPDFARATPMGGVIAHGTMALNLLLHVLDLHVGNTVGESVTVDIRFRSPVRPGETVEAGGTRPAGARDWQVWVRTLEGREVISGTAACETNTAA